MATLRQSASSSFAGADPASITLGSTPVSGNLLVLVASERSGTASSNYTVSGITGWTQTISLDIELANGTYRRTHIMWWKVAGASESTSISVDNGTTNHKWASCYEYQFETGEDQWTLLDSISNNNGTTGNATSISTGTTGSQSGEMFIVASLVAKHGNTTESIEPVSWDTGLSLDVTYAASSSNDMDHSVGSDAKDTVTGTKSSTATLTLDGNNLGLSAALLVFDVESGGGGGPTVKPPKLINLDNQFAPITAARLGGVLEQ